MAAGTARYSSRRKLKPFDVTRRGQIRRDYKVRYGKNWHRYYRARTSKYRQFSDKPGAPYRNDASAQERYYRNQRNTGRRTSGRFLQVAGSTTIIVGKALPVLAYGYIGYDLVSRGASRQEAKEELERTSFGMTSDDMIATAITGYYVANTYYTATKPILGIVAEIVA